MKSRIYATILLLSLLTIFSCTNSSENNSDNKSSTEVDTTSVSGVTTSSASEKKSDARTQGLKSKVKTMSESLYVVVSGKNKLASKNVFKYDENGNRLELLNYNPDGKINSTIKSTYGTDGKIASEKTILSNGNTDINSTFKTDEKGNPIEKEDVRPGGNILFNYRYVNKFGPKGELLEQASYNGGGNLTFTYEFKYDENGNKTEWIQKGSDGSVTGRRVYTYDKNNLLISETDYDKDGSVKATYEYKYLIDKKGNWVSQSKSEAGKIIEVRERDFEYF